MAASYYIIEFILHNDNDNKTIYYKGNEVPSENLPQKLDTATKIILNGDYKTNENEVSILFANILQNIQQNTNYKIELYIDNKNNNNNNNDTIIIYYKKPIEGVSNIDENSYTKVLLDGKENEITNVSTMFATILPKDITYYVQ